MQALRLIEKVSKDGYLHVKVPQYLGAEVELIILPHPQEQGYCTTDFMEIQESGGFVKNFLASDTEDVWNDL